MALYKFRIIIIIIIMKERYSLFMA